MLLPVDFLIHTAFRIVFVRYDPITVDPAGMMDILLEYDVCTSFRDSITDAFRLTGREKTEAFCALWNHMDARRTSSDAGGTLPVLWENPVLDI